MGYKMKEYQNQGVLKKLYWKERLSQRAIARKFAVSQKTINNWMKKLNIERRYYNRPDITKELLEELYFKKKLSMPKIAEKLNVTYDTIWQKMRKYCIKVRSMSEAKMKYPKLSFSDNLREKSYILGLRVGDISTHRASKQITVNTASTHPAQLEMFKNIFGKYSKINSYLVKIKADGRKAWIIYCRLNDTFNFLLNKPNKIPQWILNNNQLFYSFLAGYSDCEACWNIYKSKGSKKARARFQIISGDKTILKQINDKLIELNFKPNFRLAHKKGYRKPFGKYNKDMYYLVLNHQSDIIKLSNILIKFSHHSEKIWKMEFILENRGKLWEEIKYKIDEFKKWLMDTNLNSSYNTSSTASMP